MNVPKNYVICKANDTTNLMLEVFDWIGRGWTPQGGVCHVHPGGHYLQAMVLIDEELDLRITRERIKAMNAVDGDEVDEDLAASMKLIRERFVPHGAATS